MSNSARRLVVRWITLQQTATGKGDASLPALVISKAEGEIKKKKKFTKTASRSLNKSLSSINAIFQRLLDFHCKLVLSKWGFLIQNIVRGY